MAFELVFVALVFAVSQVFSAELGQRCESDGDCTSSNMECIRRFDECEEKACWCKPDSGGRFYYGSCQKVLTNGERCDGRSYTTFPDEYDCVEDECVLTHIPAGQECDYPFPPPYTSCTEGAYCQYDTDTNKYTTCKCSDVYIEVNGKCKKNQWGEACSAETCESYGDVYCIRSRCGCHNESFTHKHVKQDGDEYDVCLPTGGATTDTAVGGACKLNDISSDGKLCAESLTCSKCLLEEAPTCITPGGGADAVGAHVYYVITTLLMSKLLW